MSKKHPVYRPGTAVPVTEHGQFPSTAAVPSRGGHDHSQGNAVRAWARKAGYKVGTRGRISAKVLEAFQAAHEDDTC